MKASGNFSSRTSGDSRLGTVALKQRSELSSDLLLEKVAEEKNGGRSFGPSPTSKSKS